MMRVVGGGSASPLHAHRPTSSMIYRLQQLVRALTGRITAQEWQSAAGLLSAGELQLFRCMPRFDQRHCLDVMQTLRHAGHHDRSLLAAALLHDVGKVGDDGKAIPLVYYGVFVVVQKLAPSMYKYAAASGRGLLRPFAQHASHERRAVHLAIAAGSAPEVVAILQDYAEQRETEVTRLLAWADGLN